MNLLKWLIIASILLLYGCSEGSTTKEKVPITNVPLRIACVGDSITEGYNLLDAGTESYPAQLARLVAGDIEVQNFGIRGTTALKRSNAPYWNTSHYQNSLAFHPEVVVIMFGTNDIKDINWKNKADFVGDYTALIQSYQNLESKPTVYICLTPPVYANIQGITNRRIVDELQPRLREVASNTGIEIIDMFTLLNEKESLFPDKIHPNVEGASQMAHLVYQTIY
jgi:lysophospholipase L1-like esterase